MENIFIVVVLLVVFFVFVQKRLVKNESIKDSAYKRKGAILSVQESAVYNALVAAVGEHGIVLAKVNLSNVLTPVATDKKNWFVANNRIAKSYFDFVICDPRSLEVRVAIELDNGRELDKGKVDRQKLLMHVCQSASIPLIGTSIKHSYQVGRLRRLLAAHIDLIEPDKEIRFCKKCGSPMVVKVANQGEFKGRRFFTCSRQPQCTYTENYNVVFED
ncbi:DUF2726 domain-containing protein [Vibrio genomosp. F10]|uniref:DUF2726 domain-containing protein n=2 Tax=Vibrio genomosp. F10 TaxID=723171 RepID=A0A1B9QWX8_9VIBR|nr:DUF2726 domain-containing protein [Vibrio genomosp. F10]OCH74273.1 hypothetical protein A6E14_13175 [Vibrio genomosp. F10]OEE34647.1 hypothetical protein A1QO_07370 [Vibrio genomosp. F10 str. ZF-129]OEF03696.1 hypothetical protein A1QK_10465 [Vibrio genomosp. F10 str. 9ZD137]OEF05127.1 hypothetical protein A1QI_08715 [Vibrio genomosp. F10 str. 9ZB36]